MSKFTRNIALTDEERIVYEKRRSGLNNRLVADEVGIRENRVRYLYRKAKAKLVAQERLSKYYPEKRATC